MRRIKKHFGIALMIAVLITIGWLMPSCVETDANLASRVTALEGKVESLRTTYMCRMFLNHTQVIQRWTPTKIELDVTSYDPNSAFDATSHEYIVQADGNYLIIGAVWYDFGAVDGGMYSVQVRRNNIIIMERDDMSAHPTHKDIQPHAVDLWPLKAGDKISLWTVYYFGGPCELKFVERENYLTIFKVR